MRVPSPSGEGIFFHVLPGLPHFPHFAIKIAQMAYFFSTISELKEQIGGGANVSLEISSLDPSIADAMDLHIRPVLGQEFTSELLLEWIASEAETPIALSDETVELLPYLRRALAKLAMYEYAKIGGIQFSEAGIMRVETENSKSAYKYQENQYKQYMLTAGYEAIEQMLMFLNDNRADYTTWRDSDEGERSRSSFLNYAADFRLVQGKGISRYTFDILRPIMEDIETFAILPLIGDEQFDALKTAIAGTAAISATDKQLIAAIQRAVAAFALKEATQKLLVQTDGNNIVQTEALEPQSYNKTSPPSTQVISLSLYQQDVWANRLISNILRILVAGGNDYPLYVAFKEAEAEALAAEEEAENTDAERDGDFYQLWQENSYTAPTSRGAVNL